MFAVESPPTQLSQAITFAIVGGIFAFGTLWYTTSAKRKDTEISNARLDRVEAAALAAATASEAKLASLERHTERIEMSQDIMHAMLNSAQTSQMVAFIVTQKNSRASLRTQLMQARDLAALRGTDQDPVVLAELAALQEQITQLGNDIAAQQDAVDDRMRAQELAESRERNKTRDNMPNMVSSMVPVGSTDPATVPAVADKLATPVKGIPATEATINIENATIEAGTVTVQPKEK